MPKSSITLSTGNRKIVGANIFNLPVGTTCKPGVLCSKFCYSKKAERTYPAVRPARMRNYQASKKDSFVSEMTELLRKSKYKVTRIHEGGDFYSKEYIRKWYQIAESLPDNKFFAYTKRDDLFVTKVIRDRPDNFTIIYSVDGITPYEDTVTQIPTKALEYDKVAYITDHRTNCPSTSKNGWKKACVRDCKKCFDNKTETITFARH